MKRIVDVYIESVSGSGDYSKLELFNDEKIELTSTIQNIQDISKVYTDFTQSFTVPASTNNNSILHHFYQSDVDVIDDGWNFNFRIRAKIEIDLVPFRNGTIMMEKANIKNGRTDSYTLTFYGDLVSLKDKFGETKLSDLDFTAYDIDYTAANVINRVTTDSAQNLMFPLISSKRYWTYNDGTSTDIKTTAGAIVYSELFPALKVARIFEIIQAKFDVTFNSQFFVDTNDKWEKLYLWLKNEEVYTTKTSAVTADIVSPDGQLTIPGFSSSVSTFPSRSGFFFDSSVNTFTCQNVSQQNITNTITKLLISVTNVSDANIEYYIDLYKNGVVIKTYTAKGNVSPNLLYVFYTSDNNSVFKLKVRSKNPLTLKLNATLNYPNYNNFNQTIQFNSTTTTAKTDISSKIPDMTVADFFSGILKMFNATCYATSVDVFTLEPIDMWYNGGNIFDITEYTDIDSIDVERVSVFKNIEFKYQKSECFLNRQFYDNNIMDREYAETKLILSNEGTDYKVELPFENLLMTNLNTDNFDVGLCLTKAPDFKPYIPKPVLFYYDDYRGGVLNLNNGSATTEYYNFNIFNNNVTINGVVYSLTWHPELSTQYPNLPLVNNLYSMYYNSYLQNIFNPKCRLVRVKAHFPLSLITKLRLNDRLIIRDKRYIINELKSDITSGEVDLALINDFRPMINDSTTETVIVPSGGGTTSFPWKVPNGAIDTTFTSPVSGVTFTPSTTTTNTTVGVTVPVNTNTPTPIWTESTTDNIITDDGYNIVNEQGSGVVVPIEATNTNFNGVTSVYTFNLFQE
jgi:hypothetical protein